MTAPHQGCIKIEKTLAKTAPSTDVVGYKKEASEGAPDAVGARTGYGANVVSISLRSSSS
jgi:hypothetical protein